MRMNFRSVVAGERVNLLAHHHRCRSAIKLGQHLVQSARLPPCVIDTPNCSIAFASHYIMRTYNANLVHSSS